MIKQISIKTRFGWISAFEEKGRIVLFLNTHNITFKKFFTEIESQFKLHQKSKTQIR